MDYMQSVGSGLMSSSVQCGAQYGAASCTTLFQIYMFPVYGVSKMCILHTALYIVFCSFVYSSDIRALPHA